MRADDFQHIIRLIVFGADEAIDLCHVLSGRLALNAVKAGVRLMLADLVHDAAHLVEALLLGIKLIVGNAGNFGVRLCAAEGLCVHILANGSLYEVRAGKEDGAVAFHHQRLVAHDGQVRAAGHASCPSPQQSG